MRKRLLMLIATMIIPTLLGVMQIYDWLRQKSADPVVYVDQETSFYAQPGPTRDLLSLLSGMRMGPEDSGQDPSHFLFRLGETIRTEWKQPIIDNSDRNLVVEGTKILSPPRANLPDCYYNEAYNFRVINQGSQTAKDFKLTVMVPAFFDMWREGEAAQPTDSGGPVGEIGITSLAPGDAKFIRVWLTKSGEPHWVALQEVFKASFDGGQVPVVAGRVSRTGNNYVMEISRQAVRVIVISMVVLSIVVLFSLRRRKQSSMRLNS